LLYSKNCTSRGVGRFDLNTGEELEPYAQDVAGLVLNPARDQWVAVNQDGRLILGTPGQLETQTLNNDQPAELVYWGTFSDSFYYTTWETVYDGDLSDVLGRMNDSIWISPFFDSGQASIRRYTPATGSDELIWSGQDYAYARIREDDQGRLIFAVVETGDRLYSALSEQQVTNENLGEYLPTVRVQMLEAGADQPVLIFAPAERYTLWQ
jgi:hypothetical protein